MATDGGKLISSLLNPDGTAQTNQQGLLGAGAGGANFGGFPAPDGSQDSGGFPAQPADTGTPAMQPPTGEGGNQFVAPDTGDAIPIIPGPPIRNPDGLIGAGAGGANGPAPVTTGQTDTPTPDTPAAPTANDPGRSADKQALINQLQARAAQGTNIDPNDPVIKQQVDAYSAQQERARRDYEADQAESNSPYNTGQQAGIERMTAEKLGQNVGQFESTLMSKELESRRNEIQSALDSLGNTLSDEEKSGLQRDLANLNSALQTNQSGQQNQQFYAGLNQQDKQFVDQLQQGERFHNMDDALKRYEDAQQNTQFISKLAQDGKIADMQNALDSLKVSNQDKQFMLSLAQQGKYADLDNELKKAQLSQDNNQFIAQLAQQGKLAEMDDLFRRMQLAQNESQFIDRLGFDTTQAQNEWDWKQRGNG